MLTFLSVIKGIRNGKTDGMGVSNLFLLTGHMGRSVGGTADSFFVCRLQTVLSLPLHETLETINIIIN